MTESRKKRNQAYGVDPEGYLDNEKLKANLKALEEETAKQKEVIDKQAKTLKEYSDKIKKCSEENEALYKKLSEARKAAEEATKVASTPKAPALATSTPSTPKIGNDINVGDLSKADKEIYEGIITELTETSDKLDKLRKNALKRAKAKEAAKLL